MMNQTKKHTTGKKLLALLLALIMTVSLLPMFVFAAEPGAEETPVVEGQTQPAAETGADDADQAQESDADSGEEDADVTDDAESDADVADDGIAAFAATDATTNQLTFTTKDNYSYVALANTTNTSALPTTDSSNPYRIVMLDCGRKYFTVQQIKTLIDTMAQYKYNQLQLSFGNGGCRLLLDDMDLTYVNATLTTEYVQTQIKEGNKKFNGNENCLTQDEMSAIIAYAKGKNIEIIPMLNMPGHAKAIDYVISRETDDILNTSDNTVREFAFALLKKYVDYFKGQGCKYFHFGSDESKESGTSMSTFLASCANIIANAGLRPRAFNDETKLGTAALPNFVQITYWINYSLNNSETAKTLNNRGYQLINTHGNWYYVIKESQSDNPNQKYWNGTVNTAGVSIELPTIKADNLGWRGINEFYDGYSSTIDANRGTMFCIWCDWSGDEYLTSDQVISDNANYGALYQIQELAKHYWGDEIDTSGGDTGDTVAEQPVKLEVGQSFGPDEVTGNVTAGEQITDNNKYIATANVTTGTAQAASVDKVTSITSGKKYLITMGNYVVTDREITSANFNSAKGLALEYQALTSNNVDSLKPYLWTITGDATSGYTVVDVEGKYLSINGNNSVTLSDTRTTLNTTSYSGKVAFYTDNGYYLDNFGGSLASNPNFNTIASAYYNNPPADNNKWTLYEITEETTGGNTLTITGTGEGETSVTVGNTKYIIEVTAPTKTETVSIVPEGSTTLQPDVPTGGSVTYTLSAENNTANVTLDASTGVVTASEKTGSATVTAVVKNAGDKVVAHYTYTITVSEIDFTNAPTLPVELWVTNLPIGKDENSNTKKWNELSVSKTGNTTYCTPASIKLQPEDVYAVGGEAGVELLSQVIPDGVAFDGDGKVATYNNEPIKYVYWKGVVLQNGLKQYHGNSDYSHDDCSDKGIDFEMIRYTADGWQYYAKNTWNPVKEDDTLIAYYMQKFVVSNEVTTTTRDWGKIAGDGGAASSTEFGWQEPAPDGYFGVGYAVVYGDKSMSPSTERGIWDKTLQMRYCYDPEVKSSDPGYILAYDTENYKITKVTITRGYHADSSGEKITSIETVWNKDDQVLWNKKTNDAGSLWYDETEIWNAEDGKRNDRNAIVLDPTIWQDIWETKLGNNEAFLILFYVEEVQKDTNLKLVYWDDNAKQQINPKEIQISVKDGVTYLDPEKGLKNVNPLQAGLIALPDNAYITNSAGVDQPFNKDITVIEGVAANYRSGIYEYYKAEISEDGKTLTLHYRLKAVESKHQFVVDFGLSVEFTDLLSWFNVTDKSTVAYLSVAKANKLTESTGSWGSIKINETTWNSMTYTLDKMLSAVATIPLYCKLTTGAQTETQIEVIPASNVYYEDSFVNFTPANDDRIVGWSIVNDNDQALGTASETVPQALEELGKSGVYGYDTAYDNCTKFSMGTARKTTVYDDKYALADFTFKGTGFDIISLTSNRSGTMIVTVTGAGKNNAGFKKNYMVDTYYGYAYEGDQWVVKENDPNTLYQIPVMKVTGLGYGTYKATVTVAYNKIFDHAAADSESYGEYDFYLDAVRVYEPLGPDGNDYYKRDGEGWSQYIEIRDQLITNKTFDGKKGVVFIDGKENADIEEYKSYGPNNEVYLLPNQSIAFKLSAVDNVDEVHIGAKAPMGNAKLKVTGNGTTGEFEKELGTATEMYYNITEYAITGDGTSKKAQIVTITNTSTESTILSLTNVKVTFESDPGTTKVTLPMDASTAQAAVAMVRAMYAPVPVVPEVFEPERFEASWNRSTVKVGQKATLTVKTSTDVDAITVDGVIVTNYRTRTQRTGWGWNATKVTYREFTYTITAAEAGTLDYSVAAVNADGVSSEPITAMLTVQAVQRPQRPGWLDKLFSRWF